MTKSCFAQPKVVTDLDEEEIRKKMEELGLTPDGEEKVDEEDGEEDNEEGMTAPKELDDEASPVYATMPYYLPNLRTDTTV